MQGAGRCEVAAGAEGCGVFLRALIFGFFSLRNFPAPITVPPVPTPAPCAQHIGR